MTNDDILKVARDHQWMGGAEGWTFNRKEDLITFARRIAAMQRLELLKELEDEKNQAN